MILLLSLIKNQEEKDCQWLGINTNITDKIGLSHLQYKCIADEFFYRTT